MNKNMGYFLNTHTHTQNGKMKENRSSQNPEINLHVRDMTWRHHQARQAAVIRMRNIQMFAGGIHCWLFNVRSSWECSGYYMIGRGFLDFTTPGHGLQNSDKLLFKAFPPSFIMSVRDTYSWWYSNAYVPLLSFLFLCFLSFYFPLMFSVGWCHATHSRLCLRWWELSICTSLEQN